MGNWGRSLEGLLGSRGPTSEARTERVRCPAIDGDSAHQGLSIQFELDIMKSNLILAPAISSFALAAAPQIPLAAAASLPPAAGPVTGMDYQVVERGPDQRVWEKLDNRDFLVEEVPVKSIEPLWRGLKTDQSAAIESETNATRRVASSELELPAQRGVTREMNQMLLATAKPPEQGVVLDYLITIYPENYGDWTFRADSTYLISGAVGLG